MFKGFVVNGTKPSWQLVNRGIHHYLIVESNLSSVFISDLDNGLHSQEIHR